LSEKTLNVTVSIIVPSTAYDEPLTPEQYTHEIEQCLIFMSNTFGGATAIAGQGGWLSGDTLILEDVTIVTSWTNSITLTTLKEIVRYAHEMKHRLLQEAVFIEVNGKARFI